MPSPTLSVLIVEDHPDLLDDMQFALQREGFTVQAAANVQQCLAALQQQRPDMLILDIMLPDGSGLDLARQLQGTPGMGIVMLTALGSIEQRVSGLDLADAYLTKPVDIRELAAVMRSLYRRLLPSHSPCTWTLDSVARQLHTPQGHSIPLTHNEMQLLSTLAESPKQEASTQKLITALGGNWLYYEKNRMELIISRLRRKIAKAAPDADPVIKAIRNGGYALALHIEVVKMAPPTGSVHQT